MHAPRSAHSARSQMPQHSRSTSHRRLPSMPYPALVPFPATPCTPARGAHGLLMNQTRPGVLRAPSHTLLRPPGRCLAAHCAVCRGPQV